MTGTQFNDDGTFGRAVVRGIQNLRDHIKDLRYITKFQSAAGYLMYEASKRRSRDQWFTKRLAEYAYAR